MIAVRKFHRVDTLRQRVSRDKQVCRAAVAGLAVGFALATSTTAGADPITYTGPDGGFWSSGGNWTPNAPAPGDDVSLGAHASTTTDLHVNFDTTTNLNSLTINSAALIGTMIFNQNVAASSMNATNEYLGTTVDENTYNQSAGVNNVANLLSVGEKSAGNTYNLSGNATLNVTHTLDIGNSGTGVFGQTGGTNTVQNTTGSGGPANLSLGVSAMATGTYNFSVGVLNADELQVGVAGHGNFIQTGGVFTGGVDVGRHSGSPVGTGIYTISGGTINSSAFFVNGGGTFNMQSGSGNQQLGSLTVAAGGTVTESIASPHTVLVAGSLSNSGLINLTNNDLIVQGTTAAVATANLAAINNQLKSGFNAHAGYWNGATGIESSKAAGDTKFLTTLGNRQSAGGVFDGINSTTNDVLVKYTYYGDANLDGSVNGADYQQIDTGFGMHLTGWSNGDFNYDGVVDGSDFSLIDNTFNQINASGASPLAIIAGTVDVTAVPEPAMLGLAWLGISGWLARRRRGKV